MLGCLQMDATLLTNNSQHCWMLHVASVCTPCCILLDVVVQSLKLVKLFSQQLPTSLLFCDRQSIVQQCWIRLHSSSNIVGAAHAHYAWFTKTYKNTKVIGNAVTLKNLEPLRSYMYFHTPYIHLFFSSK